MKASFQYFYFLGEGEKVAYNGDDVHYLLPQKGVSEVVNHDGLKTVYVGHKEPAIRVGHILANHFGKPIEVREDNSNDLIHTAHPISLPNHSGFVRQSRYVDYQTENLAEFFVFAQFSKMMPEDFEQGLEVLVTVEYLMQELSRLTENRLWSDGQRNAFNAAQAAKDAGYHYMIVEYMGDEEPDPDQLRYYELFGVNS